MTTLFHRLLRTYRLSLKRIPGVHRSLYFVGQHVALPLLERWKGFWTIPDDPLYFRLELLLGKYEPETVAFFKRYVKSGMVVLDVGAHVGYYTRLFSGLVGSSGLVIAFEPHPVHFHFLTKNVGKWPNVRLIPKAVGTEAGTVTIYDSPVESGGASLGWFEEKWKAVKRENLKEIAPRLKKLEETPVWEVEMARIDDVLRELAVSRVDVVKIDVEGAEVLALRGAKQVLSGTEALIVFEVAPENLRGFGYVVEDLVGLLEEYGYRKFGVLTDRGVEIYKPCQIAELSTEIEVNDYINCVASKGELV